MYLLLLYKNSPSFDSKPLSTPGLFRFLIKCYQLILINDRNNYNLNVVLTFLYCLTDFFQYSIKYLNICLASKLFLENALCIFILLSSFRFQFQPLNHRL